MAKYTAVENGTEDGDAAREYGETMRQFRGAKLRVLEAFERALVQAVQTGLTGSVSVKVQFRQGRQQPAFECVTTSYLE